MTPKYTILQCGKRGHNSGVILLSECESGTATSPRHSGHDWGGAGEFCNQADFCAHYFADNYGPYTHPWGVRAKLCGWHTSRSLAHRGPPRGLW